VNDAAAPSAEVMIGFSAEEALVLFELLSRWSEYREGCETPGAACFESPAEPAVLDALCCLLERQMAEPFRADYADLLAEARDRLTSG
jgi:hypothetical protein